MGILSLVVTARFLPRRTRSLDAGDDQTMSAILSAPPMLSGLSEPEVEGFSTMWRLKRWPAEVARIAQLEKAAGAVKLISHQRIMSNPGIVAEAKRFQKASADANRARNGEQLRWQPIQNNAKACRAG